MSDIELHSAGATVRAKTPFHDLPTFSTDFEMTREFVEKWVAKFYMSSVSGTEFADAYNEIKNELTEDIVEKLLGDFNWRTRSTGAIFALLKDYRQFEDIIGNHLLKSEVCYAGTTYGLVFAVFNSDKAIYYLKEYLKYYLTRKDLHFDQAIIMRSLFYIDETNGTQHHKELLPLWEEYSSGKDLCLEDDWIKDQINSLIKLKETM